MNDEDLVCVGQYKMGVERRGSEAILYDMMQ